MSFTPDVPSSALGPNEYNDGLNVESDVRGIRSVAGDLSIFNSVPGTPTFVSGGYRQGGEFWFIVACEEGKWYATNGTTQTWYDITPGEGVGTYTQTTNIMDAWNGTVPFFNDSQNPPMFFPDEPYPATMVMYVGNISPSLIYSLTYTSPTTYTLDFGQYDSTGTIIVPYSYPTAPYVTGDKILITGVSTYFNGTYTVVSCTTSGLVYTATPGASPPSPLPTTATVSAAYTWNYNPNWLNYTANFLRLYSTPNVGSILVAGNLTVTNLDNSTSLYPVTVQWSQSFGLNEAPTTWQPTITNVANQLEVPLRGEAIDCFPAGGNFFICSFWDTVVFSPINYSTTSAPILGVSLFTQGRGLLSGNCWALSDQLVYGVDARDIWVFDGTTFKGLGNQKIKNWFFDQLKPENYNNVFMRVNTQKNQLELYYPDNSSTTGIPNKMISYRFDLQVWNSPRNVTNATFACESPVWTQSGSSWVPNNSSRTIVYVSGTTDSSLQQKDYGYTINNQAISSYFRRNNIKLLKDYSGKLMVHRLLPEAMNIGGIPFNGDYNKQVYDSTGTIVVEIDGSDSVGQPSTESTSIPMTLDTSSPWCQIDQNTHRINTITVSNTSDQNIWMCTGTTWQYSQTEDDR
jgi:hypothetical protein